MSSEVIPISHNIPKYYVNKYNTFKKLVFDILFPNIKDPNYNINILVCNNIIIDSFNNIILKKINNLQRYNFNTNHHEFKSEVISIMGDISFVLEKYSRIYIYKKDIKVTYYEPNFMLINKNNNELRKLKYNTTIPDYENILSIGRILLLCKKELERVSNNYYKTIKDNTTRLEHYSNFYPYSFYILKLFSKLGECPIQNKQWINDNKDFIFETYDSLLTYICNKQHILNKIEYNLQELINIMNYIADSNCLDDIELKLDEFKVTYSYIVELIKDI